MEDKHVPHPSCRAIFALLAAVSGGLLASVLILGEVFYLEPRYLCNFQRLLYIVIALLALYTSLINLWPRVSGVLIAAAGLWGVASAAEQTWVRLVPDQVTGCGFSDPTIVEAIVNWLSDKWSAMFMVTGLCAVKVLVFLGLSLAKWPVLCFLALTAVG